LLAASYGQYVQRGGSHEKAILLPAARRTPAHDRLHGRKAADAGTVHPGCENRTADKLVIRDGNSGQARTVTKRDKIDEFLALVKDVTFTPQRDQADRTGWRYQITLSDGDREFRFTTESIDGTYYDTNPDIRTIVDDFYRGLDTTDDE